MLTIEDLWVSDEEYNLDWLPIKQKIFSGKKYPEMIFKPEYYLYGITSTGLLVKEEIEILQECFKLNDVEEDSILIMEDREQSRSHIRFRLSVNQPWYKTLPAEKSLEELVLEKFQLTTGCYCVFGSNGTWAKYAAIDLVDMDMDIWAFKSKEFMESFKLRHRDFPDNINKNFKKILPEKYARIEL